MIVRTKGSYTPADSFTKVVVDVERGILAAGCEYHIDCAEELSADGSKSEHLWGANVHFDERKVYFVSLINIKPTLGNRKMEILLPEVRKKVEGVINAFIL